ncbi:ATPase, T2SS/T4P/T4SS family [Sneathia sanguinegens]|uniref:ATPase, T2SS/T4P/T4SS family n=1 Tax=Sneathia sanguinegens TaxID=40543 RepID=A0ABT7HJ53_9FUSO|nr:ATPase, T2SS/T4P/T4SS family [Sneathia sanguinegens]MDK9580553.1 ATPase, T2SS/T4P/T4SS family [Sneathia sanguinegens]
MKKIIKEDIAPSNVFISNNTILIVNDIISYGIKNKASDIHIRDYYGKCIIEYRINGLIKEYKNDYSNSVEIISRIKIMSKMNVAEKRLPQDGNITFENYDLRICVIPTISGENVVIRILNSTLDDISLKALGFSTKSILNILKAICKSHGLILVTGPTGSGKSTTLLSITKLLNDGTRKIISIEDPVENKVSGIVQVQVNDDIGLSFPTILRSSLRSDPDVIIISEIRDELTAKIAVRASLTGHLVLATLHTNDCISSFARLIDMNIPKYLILDSILMIISQRLLNSSDDKKIKNRFMINEVLYLTEKEKDIFSKYTLNSDILENLKLLNFKTMMEDASEKGYNI